jgi:hypothetical protein
MILAKSQYFIAFIIFKYETYFNLSPLSAYDAKTVSQLSTVIPRVDRHHIYCFLPVG